MHPATNNGQRHRRPAHCPPPVLHRLAIVLAVSVLSPFILEPIFAQQPPALFHRISTQQGLSQATVNAVVEDRQGFLWFGTQDGLNRYDGYSFTIMRHNPLDSTSLSNSWVECLFVDSRGWLWAGTWGGGLNRYDPKRNRFIRYEHDPNDSLTLSSNVIFSITEDHTGKLWIATAHGIVAYDAERDVFTRLKAQTTDGWDIQRQLVHAVVYDGNGSLWIGTTRGLSQYTHDTGILERPGESSSHSRLKHELIYALLKDSRGNIWVGTRNGLEIHDARTNQFLRFTSLDRSARLHPIKDVRALYEDRSGMIWIGTNEDGLFRFSPSDSSVDRFSHNPFNDRTLSSSFIRSMFQDRSGVLWVGTVGSGVNRYSVREHRFTTFRHEPGNPNSLGGKTAFSIVLDHTGLLWIGTGRAGITTYSTRTYRFNHFKHDPNDPRSLGANVVRGMIEDRFGTIWVGTFGGGLNRYDRNTGTFIRYLNNPNDASSISTNNVRILYEDGSGRLWVGTWGGGLNRYDRARDRFIRYPFSQADPSMIRSNTIGALVQDSDGSLWVGGRAGIDVIDSNGVVQNRFEHAASDKKTLSHNFIMALHLDRSGTMWVGTFSGLNRFDRSTHTFDRFYEQHGLPSNVIYGILEDDRGNLWLSTNNGLSFLDPRTRSFRNFDTRHGLQANEFNTEAYHKGRDGRLYFGGIDGVTMFHPDSIKDSEYVPPIVLSRFSVFGQDLPLDYETLHREGVLLSYDQNFFSIEYASLDYNVPEKNQYAYMLEGFEADWVLSGNRRYVSYTNVPPGSYTFRVKGTNSDGVWNSVGAAVKITIVPPFWQQWWFRLLAVIAVVSLLAALYHYRVQRLLQLERLRAHIATDLHDDIGTSLTGIAITSDLSKKELSHDPNKATELLDQISKTSRELLDGMNDIVWSINPENDPFEMTLLRMQDFAVRLCEPRDIEVKFSTPSHLGDIELPMLVRRTVFLVFKEIINNAVKHAKCTSIRVLLHIERSRTRRMKGTLELQVQDNGVGFSPTGVHPGNGLRNMRTRAESAGGTCEIRPSRNSGTEVVLRLPIRIT
jgi:ligand-binding sensor domain-containing protein/signal transduction histidine kinase